MSESDWVCAACDGQRRVKKRERKECACGASYHQTCWDEGHGCSARACRNWMMLASPAEYAAAVGPAPDAERSTRRPRGPDPERAMCGILLAGIALGAGGLPLIASLSGTPPPAGIGSRGLAVAGGFLGGLIAFLLLTAGDSILDLVRGWGSDYAEDKANRRQCLGWSIVAALGAVGGALVLPSGSASWGEIAMTAVIGAIGTSFVAVKLRYGV